MTKVILSGGLILGLSTQGIYAQEQSEINELFQSGASFVRYLKNVDMDADGCVVRLSNGSERGAITFSFTNAQSVPILIELIYGHELGAGTTHGARKGDTYEVRVDGELLAVGTLEAGVAPYEGYVDEWPGALLDALAYGEELTWGFPGQKPLIAVLVPDNDAMARALVECEARKL